MLLPSARLISLRRAARALPTRVPATTLPHPFHRRSISVTAPSFNLVDRVPSASGQTNGSVIGLPPPASTAAVAGTGSGSAFASGSKHPFATVGAGSGGSDSSASASSTSATSSIPNANAGTGSLNGGDTAAHEALETSVLTSLPPPPEGISVINPVRHPFDTHAFVSFLEKSDVGSPTARALMEGVRELIIRRSERAKDKMLSKEEIDNEAYLFKAALSELRTELSVRTRNDGIALRAVTAAIRREVEGVEQKMKEDIQILRHDIDMDTNNRKSETRTEMKGYEIAIEEINNKFTISLGDLRTEIESAKWDATRRAISIIVVLVICGIGISTFTIPDSSKVEPAPVAPTLPLLPPTMVTRDIGIGTDDDLVDDDYEAKLEKLLSGVGVGVGGVGVGVGKAERKAQEPSVYSGRI